MPETTVTVGSYGDIRPMLVALSRRKEFADLAFHCDDGRLMCHKFIIGAQSSYLRRVMTSADNPADDVTVISLPGIKERSMKIILKFLYTGKLRISADQVPIVKELLERVLQIDARITLPDAPADAGGGEGEDPGGGGGDSGGGDGGGGGAPDNEAPPQKKLKKDDEHSPHINAKLLDCSGDYRQQGGPLDLSATSHTLTEEADVIDGDVDEDEDLVEILEEANRIENHVEVVVVPDEDEDDDETDLALECKYCSQLFRGENSLEEHLLQEHLLHEHSRQTDRSATTTPWLVEAPRVISKHTGGPRARSIPSAPKIVAKSTGGPRMQKITLVARSAQSFPIPAETMRSQHVTVAANMMTPPAVDEGPAIEREATSSNDKTRQRQKTRSQTGHGLPQPIYLEDEDLVNLEDGLLDLPPPIPLPPEPGLVILKGNWVTPEAAEKARAPKRPSNSVRKYNYKRGLTITGKSKPSTFDAEEDGEFICPYEGCGIIYARERSLTSHIRRNHHNNLKSSCPECNKPLSSDAAIGKHLLSHRPKESWPYFCPLCGQKFQAKGDLPKHFLTLKHRYDNLPPQGTPEWKNLCDSGECAPQMSGGRRVSWRQRIMGSVAARETATTEAGGGAASMELVPSTSTGSIVTTFRFGTMLTTETGTEPSYNGRIDEKENRVNVDGGAANADEMKYACESSDIGVPAFVAQDVGSSTLEVNEPPAESTQPEHDQLEDSYFVAVKRNPSLD